MASLTLYFDDKLPIAALAFVLESLDQFDLQVGFLERFGKENLVYAFVSDHSFPVRTKKLSTRLRSVVRYAHETGGGPRVARARFGSPGFITVDGSGALEKVIDILHQGDLAKEERKALIERITAETDLLRSQAAKQKLEVLSGAIAVLQSLGLERDDIIRLISKDGALVRLLGMPIVDIEGAQRSGVLRKLAPGATETDEEADR